ncbi:hypothetical protein CYMTET_22906 [Cymbomonas tetramitiformis]|uniref:LysM domain-containing protein n=1 Tax=Cymbomonas tetramitiformis TaxID=36881 RepID=A0AAE0FZA8_9CHLO|nr:hypothetical protein CYMTET_22906 [Cymbomonas tetramitiformis]|eukprot:gene16241-biopygen16746
MDGKEKADNLEANCKYICKRIQELEDSSPVLTMIGRKEYKTKTNLHYPADMASHWALFQAGGVGDSANALLCHRCVCPYHALGVVFDVYKAQRGDTANSVAAAHGIFFDELRLINTVPSGLLKE